VPSATVGLDVTGNGMTDVVVSGPDRNMDGIPDQLQTGQLGIGQGIGLSGDRAGREFDRMDRNGDGVVTEAEFKRDARRRGMTSYEAEREFDRMDRNGDGVITEGQLRHADRVGMRSNGSLHASRNRQIERKFDRMDRNGDGVVTEAEFKRDARRRGMTSYEAEREFDRMDRNGDGVVTEGEMRHDRARYPGDSVGSDWNQGTNVQLNAAYGNLIQHLQQEIATKDMEIAQYNSAQFAPSPVQQMPLALTQQQGLPPEQVIAPNLQTSLVKTVQPEAASIAQLQSNIQTAANNLQMLQQQVQLRGTGGNIYPDNNTSLLESYRNDLEDMLNQASSWRGSQRGTTIGSEYNPLNYT